MNPMTSKNTSRTAKRKPAKPNGKTAQQEAAEVLREAMQARLSQTAANPANEDSVEPADSTFVRLSLREFTQLAGLLEIEPDPTILATDALRRAGELCRVIEAALDSTDNGGELTRTFLASQEYRFTALADLLPGLQRRFVP